MNKKYEIIKSRHLGKDMNIASYGHYGLSILMFPARTDSALEYENEGLIDNLKSYIDKGRCRIYSIDTINSETWFANDISPEEKSQKHFDFNNYVIGEVLAHIFNDCGTIIPIITCGASIGGYHAANTYFRRPDVLFGAISLSGYFNIEILTNGFFDDNCYYNSPVHYLPNLNDNYWLSYLRNNHHVYLYSGSGKGEFPNNSRHLGMILENKNIKHHVDIWGGEWDNGYKTWAAMLASILDKKL